MIFQENTWTNSTTYFLKTTWTNKTKTLFQELKIPKIDLGITSKKCNKHEKPHLLLRKETQEYIMLLRLRSNVNNTPFQGIYWNLYSSQESDSTNLRVMPIRTTRYTVSKKEMIMQITEVTPMWTLPSKEAIGIDKKNVF